MDVKLLQDRLEVPQHPLGFRGALPFLGHLLDEMTLFGKPLLALGNVTVGQGELFAFVVWVGHGREEHAPWPGKEPRISDDPFMEHC